MNILVLGGEENQRRIRLRDSAGLSGGTYERILPRSPTVKSSRARN
ncbi:MAG: hypothetical protein M3R11_00325 [Acidobacteriota bacterium]|nr:hypothetical protein [Acidobacteriota bacterium]